jgi:mono/diheme cytochrome c family protein
MTRAILPLAAAALAIALSPAPAAAQTAAASGEVAYAENCAACHRTPTRFMRRYTAMTPEKRQAELDKFLTGHYAPDPTTRAAIVAWLEASHTGK